MERDSRTNLNQHKLFDIVCRSELLFILVQYLVVPEIDLSVEPVEGDHVVNEWFGLGVVLGCIENLVKHLLHQLC